MLMVTFSSINSHVYDLDGHEACQLLWYNCARIQQQDIIRRTTRLQGFYSCIPDFILIAAQFSQASCRNGYYPDYIRICRDNILQQVLV